eukprot:scaffold57468_cov62-Phaeocystis_antarctica.AAC.7
MPPGGDIGDIGDIGDMGGDEARRPPPLATELECVPEESALSMPTFAVVRMACCSVCLFASLRL